MYCYKCGSKCRDAQAYCKNCNALLLASHKTSKGREVEKSAIKDYRNLVKKTKRASNKLVASSGDNSSFQVDVHTDSPLSQADVTAFHQDCLNKANEGYKKQLEGIKAFYEPKLATLTGRAREAEDESYHGALADADEHHSATIKALGKEKDSYNALKVARISAAEANKELPDETQDRVVHSYLQYLHKREDNANDHREAAACFLVVGSILLIIGIIFYFLAFKVSSDPTVTEKILVYSSFEFIVFCVGVVVGGIMFVYGLIRILVCIVNKRKFQNTLDHFRIYYKIGISGK